DLVTGPDVERHQGQAERVGAGRDADRMADAARDGDLVLERPALVAQDELAPVEHAGHRREELCAESRVLAGPVGEGGHLRRAPDSLAPSRVVSPAPTPSQFGGE